MPSPRPHPRKRDELVPARSKSFHGRASPHAQSSSSSSVTTGRLRRPETMPDLPSRQLQSGLILPEVGEEPERRPKLTRLLLNVTVQGSVGPVMVLMPPESTVADLVAAAFKQYVKEARRPVLPTFDPSQYSLHYSQFSLESLDRVAQLQELGSRNFFLCGRRATGLTATENATTTTSSCSKQATSNSASRQPRFKFPSFSQ